MSEALTSDDLKSRDELLVELQMMRLSCARLVDQVMDAPKFPEEPTMGMWDDFSSVFPMPFDKFVAAYQAMRDGVIKEKK